MWSKNVKSCYSGNYICMCALREFPDGLIEDNRLADYGTLVVAATCNLVARIIILDNSYG